MNRSLLVAIAILISTTVFPQVRTGTFKFNAMREGHKATVTFTAKEFDASQHKITGYPCSDDNIGHFRIDGRIPIGVHCNLPKYEITAMSVNLDGQTAMVPKELFSDCYEPHLSTDRSDLANYFALKIGDDLKSVFVFMSGSDFAGSYDAIWVLRPDGKHSRFSTGQCPDCKFLLFESGFDDR